MASLLSLWVSGGLFAQQQHELSVYGGAGLSTLSYKVTAGEQKSGLGGHFGLGYNFFFSPQWDLGTGLEFASYKAGVSMNNLILNYMTVDSNGDTFEFRSSVNVFQETHRSTLLQIPLLLRYQFQLPSPGKQAFYVAAGVKAGIPAVGNYGNTASLSNAGFYAYENSLYDTQKFMGFGNFPDNRAEGKLNFKTAFFASLEAGANWKLKQYKGLSLYTGFYMDYGLNNMVETLRATSLPCLVEYNQSHPNAFAVNSILQAKYTQNGSTQVLCEKVRPLAAGIRLRLALGIDGKQKQVQTERITEVKIKGNARRIILPPLEPIEKFPKVVITFPKIASVVD